MVSLRYYVLGSRGIGLSFVGLFACLIGMALGISLYAVAMYFFDAAEMAAGFLIDYANMGEVASSQIGQEYIESAKKILAFSNSDEEKKLKSLIGLICIGIGVATFLIYTLDFLVTYLLVMLLNLMLGNKLSIPQQGRLLVLPWVIYSIACIILTVMNKMTLFVWFTVTLRIIAPTVILSRNAVKPESIYATLVPMWWVSLVAFATFIIIYLVQAKGLSLYKERQAELFKKDK